MKAITLWQPWAWAIATHWKKVETRSWSTRYRGPIAIHSAAQLPAFAVYEPLQDALVEAFKLPNKSVLLALSKVEKLPLGQIIAIATLKDVVRVEQIRDKLDATERKWGNYDNGRYAWILDDVTQAKTAIKARGRQLLWEWKVDACDEEKLDDALDLIDEYLEKIDAPAKVTV